ncbi:hypothetical protein N9515_02130 [Vicingaceae bacterium]|nr:hypothetical protein [Vicingaceae bacterium]
MCLEVNNNKGKYLYFTFVFLFYLFTTAYIFYIGRYETIHGAGVAGVIVIQVFGVTLLLSKFNVRSSFKVFTFVVSSIQLALIIIHEFDQYKPSYVIDIPQNYEGCIYLFVTNEDRSNVSLDEHGIGYIESKGNQSITKAFAASQQNEIVIRGSSNTTMIAYDVSCLEINNSNYYPQRQYDYEIKPCMDSAEFLELVGQGVIN